MGIQASQLLRIKQANADFMIANVLGSQAAVILKDIRRLGITIPFGTCTDTDAGELVALAGEAAEGAYFMYPSYPYWDESRTHIKWMNENYRKHFKGRPGYDVEKQPYPDAPAAGGWVIGPVIEEALRLALEKVPPSELTGGKVREYGIHRMNNYPVMGFFPKGITYYPNVDHRGGEYNVIHRVVDLKDTMVTDWIKAPRILPPWMEKK